MVRELLIVYGAGSVGLVMAARLERAGGAVLLVTRRRSAARAIEREGIAVEDAASGALVTARPAVAAGIEAAAGRIGEGPVLFCMRGSQVGAAAARLAAVAPGAAVVSWQNDVENEEKLARHFARVSGGVVRLTSTRVADSRVVALGAGRLVLGDFPEGLRPQTGALADRLRGAGYDVGLSRRIREDKWLKLCVNLMSAPNALIRREDHVTAAFVEIKVRLLEEARAALDAAGVAARSCDGRDRSLSEEIEHQRASLARGTSARALPVYNQVWSALRYGGPVEADGYHRRVVDLAARHGLPVPANARVLAALERAAAEGRGPECLRASELLPG